MATLALRHSDAAAGKVRLRKWLDGQWAVLFSNPEDFAPHPSTPEGFITLLADDFAALGVKPIKLGDDEAAPSWLDYAGADSARVVLDDDVGPVIDLAERTLAVKIEGLNSPFVIVLDANARCRTTIKYDARRVERARTIQDVLTVVQVLRRRIPDESQTQSHGPERLAAG